MRIRSSSDQFLHGGDHRQATDQFRNQAEFEQILGLDEARISPIDRSFWLTTLAPKPMAWVPVRRLITPSRPTKAPPTMNKDVGGIDTDQFLLRMFAAALGRHRGHGALDDLEQGLLHAFAGDIAGQGGGIGLAGDLVDLVDIDDAPLGLFDVVISRLQQADQNVFDILADISGLGQVVASAMVNGTLSSRARVWATRVLPLPVGADQDDVDFCSSTSSGLPVPAGH
jgi:hypothetical protein